MMIATATPDENQGGTGSMPGAGLMGHAAARQEQRMKIHAVQTGTVRVKASQPVGRGHGPMRQVNILLDRTWTEWLPIYAWAIETDEGVIVVDTGETARTAEPGYFPRWHPYFRLALRVDVTPEQDVLENRQSAEQCDILKSAGDA